MYTKDDSKKPQTEKAKFSEMNIGDEFIDLGDRRFVKTAEFECRRIDIDPQTVCLMSKERIEGVYLKIIK